MITGNVIPPLAKRKTGNRLSSWVVASVMLLVLLSLASNTCFAIDKKNIKIGVLAFRSPEQTLVQWAPTGNYLNSAIPNYQFEIVPMNYPQLNAATERGEIDFVLTNTAHYVTLEAKLGVSRIVTLVVSYDGQPIKTFGGVIFTRSDRDDISTLADLRGKNFLAVGPNSLGAFLVAWQQLKAANINPHADFSELLFNGMPQDNIVFRVLSGEVDAGTVRTHIFENMAKEGKVDLTDVKILNRKILPDFPYILSTNLYPEWPLSRLRHTNDDIVEKVTVALLTMKRNDPAAITGGYDRWTPPLDYQPVHELFKELRTGPYKDYGAFTLDDVLDKYTKEIIFFCLLLFCVFLFMAQIIRLNESLRKALSEVKTLRGFLPICSSCKKIRDDSGYWNKIETYIRHHSEAEFSHSICPNCADKLFSEYNESLKNDEVLAQKSQEEKT